MLSIKFSIFNPNSVFSKSFRIVLFIFSLITISPVYSQTEVQDFETGSINLQNWSYSGGSKHLTEIATSPVCKGIYSVKSKATYPPEYRTEMSLLSNSNRELKHEAEYWIGIAVYLANGWPKDIKSFDETIFQAHHRGNDSKGESWTGLAPLSLRTIDGQWMIHTVSSPTKSVEISSGKQIYGKGNNKRIGPYETDKWVEFVFNVKFTHTNSGFVRVWKDNNKVMDYKGPVGYKNSQGPYLKLGIYKSQWRTGKSKISSRTVYHDELRIKKGPGSPADVAPNCGRKINALSPPSNIKIIQ